MKENTLELPKNRCSATILSYFLQYICLKKNTLNPNFTEQIIHLSQNYNRKTFELYILLKKELNNKKKRIRITYKEEKATALYKFSRKARQLPSIHCQSSENSLKILRARKIL